MVCEQISIPKAQSLFIYNFTRLIEWPSAYKTGDFVVGVYGGGNIATELSSTLTGKKVSQQNVKFVSYNDVSEISRCHILVVPFEKSENIDEIIDKLGNQGTLIVTERTGMLEKGSVINFIIDGNSLKFELNSAVASKRGLNISTSLHNMAVRN